MKQEKIINLIKEELQKLDSYSNIEEGLDEKLIELINEYKSLPKEKKDSVPLLWWLLKKSTAYYKKTKEESDYIDESENTNTICGNCTRLYEHTTSGKYICDWVGFDKEGNDDIAFNGWCKYWIGESKE